MTYGDLARIYDSFMTHVNYQEWTDGLEFQWRKLNTLPKTVLDAGCGTGSVLLDLARRGYKVIGVDNSPDMLAICQQKLSEEGLPGRLFEMDIQNFVCPQGVDAVICLCDTLNYLLKEKDLERCFDSVFRSLNPGGSFIFDLHTPNYFEKVLANNQWVEREKDVLLIWENDYSECPLISINLTFFVKQKNGLYRKYEEEHRQKCYEMDTIIELVNRTGFSIKQLGSDLFGSDLNPLVHERMYFTAIK